MASACPAPPDRHLRDATEVHAAFAALACAAEERCGFAYLDPEWMMLGMRETAPGTPHGAGVSLREVLGDVLALSASAVVMVHNHPGGDPRPSAADIAITRRLVAALQAIDVRLVDHVVLTRDGATSMRAMGLL